MCQALCYILGKDGEENQPGETWQGNYNTIWSVSERNTHLLQGDLEGGLELVWTAQGSFVRDEVWVGIIHIIVGRGNNVLKNLETGRYGHLVDYKECCKTGTGWSTKENVSLRGK